MKKRNITALAAMVLMVVSLLAAGCGGGGSSTPGTSAPPTDAKYAITGVATTQNGGQTYFVAGANVKILKGVDQIGATQITAADGSFSLSDIPAGNVRVLVSSTALTAPRVASKSWDITLTSDYTLVAAMTEVFNACGKVQDMGTSPVRGANVTMAVVNSNPWEFYTTTTGADGTFCFNDMLAGRDYSIAVSNPGDIVMIPRIGIDTEGITITNLDRNRSDLVITGTDPTCWDDTAATDCSDSNPGGIVHVGCTNPGTAASMCVWYEGARIVAKYQKVRESGRTVFKAVQ